MHFATPQGTASSLLRDWLLPAALKSRLCAVVIPVALVVFLALSADWSVAQVPVFVQSPLLNDPPAGSPYSGQDVVSTVVPVSGDSSSAMFDDFELATSRKVTSVTWWGAPLQSQAADPHAFEVTVYTNVPASGNTPAHPGDIAGTEEFNAPGFSQFGSPEYSVTSVSDPGSPSGELHQYTGVLPFGFNLQANTIYWMTIYSFPGAGEIGQTWGWHTRDSTIPNTASPLDSLVGNVGGLPVYQGGNSALSQAYFGNPPTGFPVAVGSPVPLTYTNGVDGPTGISAYGMDMAFALYTAPEPSTVTLAGMAGIVWLAWHVRRQR